MIIFGLIALAALQVTHTLPCGDNEHIISPLDAHHQPSCPNRPQCPWSCEGASETHYNHGYQCGCSSEPPPCPCNPCLCNPCPSEPCIHSVTRVANSPCECPHGPELQSAVQCPLFPEPLVPIVENHVGHHVIKTVKRVPVLRKFCRPELVIRTRHVPIIKHRKRVFIEPYACQIPITDKLIRQVIHQIVHKIPVVQKCVKPYAYQTVRHVPLSVANSVQGVPASPCCHFPGPPNVQIPNIPPLAAYPTCNTPCPGICDGANPQLPNPCYS